MHPFGISLLGVTPENLRRAALTGGFVLLVVAVRFTAEFAVRPFTLRKSLPKLQFWTRQGLSLVMTAVLILGTLSIWFDDTARVATFLGLFSAGVAFALQKVITAWAGYFVILRGNSFTVGDRISLGTVRGDVMAVNFTQTQIMEMGEPPDDEQGPHSWVKSRQFTGRIVTISNARIFDEAVFNYSRDFPFIWDELHFPIPYGADAEAAERIVLDVARRHARSDRDLAAAALADLQRRHDLKPAELRPRVYLHATTNWLDLALRFIYEPHGIRGAKDAMTREIIPALRAAGITIAAPSLAVSIHADAALTGATAPPTLPPTKGP